MKVNTILVWIKIYFFRKILRKRISINMYIKIYNVDKKEVFAFEYVQIDYKFL